MSFSMKAKIVIINLFVLYSTSFSQVQNENYSIFKLATTPFIHKSDIAIGISSGFNYGNPSLNIQEWALPNENKTPLFNYNEVRVSFGNRVSLFACYSKMYLSIYSDGLNSKEFIDDIIKAGGKIKIKESNGYYPAVSIEFNNDYAVSFSIGSTEEKFKYYLTADCNSIYYVIPIPILLSTGIAYETISDLNIFLEGSFNRKHGGVIATNSYRTGLSYSPLNFLTFDLGLFYFGFDYHSVAPGGIPELAKKDKYYLLSGSITIDFSLLDK